MRKIKVNVIVKWETESSVREFKQDVEWKTIFALAAMNLEVVHGNWALMNIRHGCALIHMEILN